MPDVKVPAAENDSVEPQQEGLPRVFRAYPWVLLIGGIIGFGASFTLVVERIALLKDPNHHLSCSLDSQFSCGDVMTSPQGSIFGFPNPLFGVVCFTIVIVTAVALLGRARLPRWYFVGLQLGLTLGLALVFWFMHEALFEIKKMCLYCMIVWAVMAPLWLYTTLFNLNHAYTGSAWVASRFSLQVTRAHAVLLLALYLIIIVTIFAAFPWYWQAKVGLG